MLSDNIRKYRKENNMSQDEMAEKLGVSRQSISLWETGQTQPTIDNIIAISKIFKVSVDAILDNNINDNNINEPALQEEPRKEKKKSKRPTVLIVSAVAAIVCAIVAIVLVLAFNKKGGNDDPSNAVSAVSVSSSAYEASGTTAANATDHSSQISNTYAPSESGAVTAAADASGTAAISVSSEASVPSSTTAAAAPSETEANTAAPKTTKAPATTASAPKTTKAPVTTAAVVSTAATATATTAAKQFDLFSYCKEFAINKGRLNGDYCMYQQPATRYGGYENEFFSITYWTTYDKVEFCLHCPLDDVLSVNFYLIMRGGYFKQYEFLSSKYYRSTGESLRSASGYIDPLVFSDKYPLPSTDYEGSVDGQTEFLEESRVGICDLIRLLKQFVKTEEMECDFSAFGFKNF